MAYTVLIADDEKEIRSVLRLYLENAGYRVLEAADGIEAERIFADEKVDLCLLDIMMPGKDGYQVLRGIRSVSNIPVIMITAKDQDPEKILGLDLGADDYMVKPFNPLEAVARTNSMIRRYYRLGAAAAGAPAVSAGLRCRDLTLDTEACCLYRNGSPIELTSVEYRIMRLFMEHPGKVFTKQQIYECGWEDTYAVSDNNIMVCISKLRAKLSSDPSAYIRTVRGLGYRLEKG